MSHRPGTEIRYTSLPSMKYPEGASPQEITKHNMDSTYQLEQLMIEFQRQYFSTLFEMKTVKMMKGIFQVIWR